MNRLTKKIRSAFKKIKLNRKLGKDRNDLHFDEKIAHLDGQFGKAQNLEEVWSLDEEEAYVNTSSSRPRWFQILLPAVIVALFLIMVFGVLPALLPGLVQQDDNSPFMMEEPVRIYDTSKHRAVTEYATSLMSMPNVKSERVTQVLFNEVVELVSADSIDGYVLVRTTDGLEGYIKENVLTDDLDHIEPAFHQYKLVISDVSKNVMSHIRDGTLELEVMMNTVLYSDHRRDGVYHVALPGGKDGWVSSGGVIELGLYDSVEQAGVRYYVSSVLSFVNMTHLERGITKRGISVEGLAYTAASVNGVEIPRRMEDQLFAGERVFLEYDEVTGELIIESIIPGDIIFFRHPQDTSNTPHEMAICTDVGVVLMISSSRTTLRLQNITDNYALQNRIISVRRIFYQ